MRLLIVCWILLAFCKLLVIATPVATSTYLSEWVLAGERLAFEAATKFLKEIAADVEHNEDLQKLLRLVGKIRPSKKYPQFVRSIFDHYHYPLDIYTGLIRLSRQWPQILANIAQNSPNIVKKSDQFTRMAELFDQMSNGTWYHPHINETDIEMMGTSLKRIQQVYKLKWTDLGPDLDDEDLREIRPILEDDKGATADLNTDGYSDCPNTAIPRPMPWHSCHYASKTVPYYRAKVETLHENPSISIYHDMITEIQRVKIMSLASSQLRISEIVAIANSSSLIGAKAYNRRLSSQAWLDPRQHKVLEPIYKSVAYWSGYETEVDDGRTAAETFQVVNYGLGGLFRAHNDYIQKHTFNQQWKSSGGQRVTTWMFYLTEPALGGATVFPKLYYRVEPKIGSALVWDNVRPDGSPEPLSLHAGCPVAVGHKWIGNLWIQEEAQIFRRPCPADFRPVKTKKNQA